MEIINLLIIEDTASDIQSYKDVIRTFNMDNEIKIHATFKDNKIDGLKALNDLKDELDGAFIDLKLQQGAEIDLNEGNDIVEMIYKKLRFPVIVLTNTPGAFDRGRFKESAFLKVLTKTDIQYIDVLMNIVNTHRTGITKILGKKGLIETMLDNIFWNNISNTLDEWIGLNESEKPLLRYTLTHLQEYLEIADDGMQFDHFYPIENYIIPSIKKYFFTGDIIHQTNDVSKRFIILTPACDLAPHGEQSKAKTKDVLLAEVQSLNQGVFYEKVTVAKKIASADISQEKIDTAKSDLTKIITNNFSPKYYYLPDTKTVKGGLVNFQKLLNVKPTDLASSYSKEATITIQFIKDIISKFSFYYSRQGSPDFDFEKLLQAHL